ncbi:MAG: contractile injection system protein, VgrG/Pvc8 family [Pseudobdellovibrionaceae bacterium]|nr:contractile injection system protein, VgrG/Pvc8 family [Pseudobdellovibrionaceae bacterium]
MEQSSSLRSWEATTLGGIAEEIARRNQLKPAIFDELKSIAIDHEDQTESDMAFMCRLGRRHDLTVKVSGRFLPVSPADRSGAVGGAVPVIKVRNPISWEYSGDQTNKYTGVRAFWYDNGEKHPVLHGKEGVVLELEFNKISDAGARKAAEAKFREVVRKGKTLTMTLLGNTELAAERKVDVSSLGPGIDGEWVIKSVEHVIDGSGFQTKIGCSVDRYKELKSDEQDDDFQRG